MRSILIKVILILSVSMSLLLAVGCTRDINEVESEQEVLTSGFVLEKTIENDNNYITLHILKTSEDEISDLRLKATTKEDYDYFVENNYYIVSYGKALLEIKNAQLNNSLGETISRGIDDENEDIEKTSIFATEKTEYEDYTLLDSYSFDIDENGVEETIALYTAAQRDSGGDIMWDDGQIWVLVVQGEDKNYELYNNYVQIGAIDFYIFTTDDGFHITTVENTTAGLKLIDYIFSNEENSFTPKVHYNAIGNVNMLHVSSGY